MHISKYFDRITDLVREAPKTAYIRLIFEKFNVAIVTQRPFFKIADFLKTLPPPFKYQFVLTLIHIVFRILPRFIPPTIFVIEVLLFNHIHYFYASLLLYAISLFYKVLLWILHHQAHHNITLLRAHIKCEYNREIDYFVISFQDKTPDIEGAIDLTSIRHDPAWLDWFITNNDIYTTIRWLVDELGVVDEKLTDYERLYIFIMYIIGWIYILMQL